MNKLFKPKVGQNIGKFFYTLHIKVGMDLIYFVIFKIKFQKNYLSF